MKKIQPGKIYTIGDIVRDQLMPFAKNQRTIQKLILLDFEDKKILKTFIIDAPKNPRLKRYYIHGRDLTRFIAAFKKNKAFSDVKVHNLRSNR